MRSLKEPPHDAATTGDDVRRRERRPLTHRSLSALRGTGAGRSLRRSWHVLLGNADVKPHRPSVAGARHETQATQPAESRSSAPLAEQTGGSGRSQHVRRRAPSQPRALPISAHELLESIPDAVVGVDGEESIAFVNAQAAKMFRYERTELLGQQVELLLPDRLREAHARHRADYHANPGTRPMGVGLDLLARRKDGTEFPVEISLSPLSTPQGVLIVSTIRDISQRRELEKERERLLEVAGRARTEAENALQVRAEAERLKNDLTNMVVHDLKNPVNGITMLVRLLLRKGSLSETQQTNLIQIERACRELLRLVANVLEIAKIEAGEMPVATERIVLAELVDEVAAEYGPAANEVGRCLTVAVATDLPPAVADRALLKRVLVNLVANALRHSGSMEVCVEAAPEPAGLHIAIRVVDHGHGIPEADQARIFDKFKTMHGDTTADTGLGLPFCKLAVERMQGHIALSSAPGTGTAFIVTLPCARLLTASGTTT